MIDTYVKFLYYYLAHEIYINALPHEKGYATFNMINGEERIV